MSSPYSPPAKRPFSLSIWTRFDPLPPQPVPTRYTLHCTIEEQLEFLQLRNWLLGPLGGSVKGERQVGHLRNRPHYLACTRGMGSLENILLSFLSLGFELSHRSLLRGHPINIPRCVPSGFNKPQMSPTLIREGMQLLFNSRILESRMWQFKRLSARVCGSGGRLTVTGGETESVHKALGIVE